MCGIAGVLDLAGQPVDRATIGNMVHHLEHRGPDANGICIDGCCGLGHARLGVIDIAAGAQPLRNAEANVVLSFNGAIYNFVELRKRLQGLGYQFRTGSDTEVVLNMYLHYGEDCFTAFNGEWALAIWDGRKRKLLLSRDRIGAKPLYYTQTSRALVFASTIKAVLLGSGVPPSIDLAGLYASFMFWSPGAPRTLFSNVKELLPGSLLVAAAGSVHCRRYWQFDFSAVAADLGEADARATVSELLTDAVGIRLRADLPVAAYLSGGLDSAIIAALANAQAPAKLRTYSLSFAEHTIDEAVWQRRVAEHLGVEQHEIPCRNTDVVAAFPEAVRHAEQPLVRTAAVPMFLLSATVRANGDKVVMTGEGADELFGGYDIFKEVKLRRFLGVNPRSHWRAALYRRLYPDEPNLRAQPQAFVAAFFNRPFAAQHSRLASHLPRWLGSVGYTGLFATELKSKLATLRDDLLTDLDASLPPGYDSWGAFEKAQYLEATQFLPGSLLSTQGDRPAMAHGVETRLPFLDPRLVDFAVKLPLRLKMPGLREKYLLRKVAEPMLPADLVGRRKFAYRGPDARSLLIGPGAEGDYLRELLERGKIISAGLFDADAVQRLVAKVRAGSGATHRDSLALTAVLSTQCLVDLFMQSPQKKIGYGTC